MYIRILCIMENDGVFESMHNICINLLRSVLSPKCAIYVAGPLDSGLLYFESILQQKLSPDEIRAKNQERLTEFVGTLRLREHSPVIDPGLLRIPNWTGHDYGKLFVEIIEIFAKEAWFLNGWEFSNGATKEFMFCISNRIPCYDEKKGTLTQEKGMSMIENAVTYLESRGVDVHNLRSRLDSNECPRIC